MIHREKEYNYMNMNLKKFVKEKSLLDMDMIFDRYPNEIFPFDFDTYFSSDIRCEIVATNCLTGKAEFLTEDHDGARLLKLSRASSSMPLLSPIVNIDVVPYLDGGIADSVPIKRALEIGNEKIVVVLTSNLGYRKKPVSEKTMKLYRHSYKTYPYLLRSIRRRSYVYNDTMKQIEQLESEGKIFVIRPQIKTISRLERKYENLMGFYQHGYDLMEQQYQNLLTYLEK